MVVVLYLPEWVLVTARALILAVARYKESKALLQVPGADLWSMVWGTDEQRPFDSMECDVCSAAGA